MDTAYFEQMLGDYIKAVNSHDQHAEIDAAWECIREAANLLGIPIPTGDASIR